MWPSTRRIGHRRRVGPHIARVAVRQVQHEVGLLLNTANPDQSLAEVGLRMARRMRQRHEHFLPTAFRSRM